MWALFVVHVFERSAPESSTARVGSDPVRQSPENLVWDTLRPGVKVVVTSLSQYSTHQHQSVVCGCFLDFTLTLKELSLWCWGVLIMMIKFNPILNVEVNETTHLHTACRRPCSPACRCSCRTSACSGRARQCGSHLNPLHTRLHLHVKQKY